MKRFVLGSLHPQYFDKMMSGEKDLEHGRNIQTENLPNPFFMFWYLTSPKKTIQGISVCDSIKNYEDIPIIETIELTTPISLKQLQEQFNNISGKKFHPPQSWAYLRDDIREYIELLNPSLKEFYNKHPATHIPELFKLDEIKQKAASRSSGQYKLDF